MITLYVLDVPEFRPLVDTAQLNDAYRVTASSKGYWTIQSETELVFNRREMKLKPAIWYGAFTGGIDGKISEFGQNLIRVISKRPGHI